MALPLNRTAFDSIEGLPKIRYNEKQIMDF